MARPLSRSVVCVGDLHVGSDYALWTTVTRSRSGSSRRPSEIQEKLLAYWNAFWRWADPYDTVILLGDICDGNNRRESGRNLTSVELEEQVDAACKLLLPHTKGKCVWGVSGSGYHQSIDMDLDALVTCRINGTHAGAILNLELTNTGKIVQVRHGSSSSVMYRGGNMDMESLLLDAAQGTGILPFKVDILIRGHWHWFSLLSNRSRTIVQVPGWKLLFPYKSLDRYGKYLPDIGGIKLTVSSEDIVVSKRLFDYIPVLDRVMR